MRYVYAVAQGNTKAVQQMVDDAAKTAGHSVEQKQTKGKSLPEGCYKERNITKDIVSSYGTNPKSNFLRDASEIVYSLLIRMSTRHNEEHDAQYGNDITINL